MTAATATAAGELDVRLDAPLPASVKVGGGTVLFVAGTSSAPVESLSLLVDGAEQALMAAGMPRPGGSGFWGIARVRDAAEEVVIGLRAGDRIAELARVEVVQPEAPLPGAPLVAIAMATFEPPVELFRRQVESIRAQGLTDWLCIVSDDNSDPARFAELEAVVGGDPRFVVSRSDRRRGFYGNFERALELVPRGARYVALADQDDAWDPDKLDTLVGAIGDARLVYSDQRIVSAAGEPIADTYWGARANNHEDMLSLLVANCVTGAASLFRRDLLDDALPFPPAQFAHYHDHWLALTALATGGIRYVPRPLYDYVQHEHATIGHATATRMVRLRDRLSSLRRGPRERVRLWRGHYFADACRVQHLAAILELRCGPRMSRRKRRAAAMLLRADRSLAPVPRLFARGARELARRRPETLGAEWMLGYTFLWRRLLAARLEAPPPALLQRGARVRVPGDPDLRALAEQLLPLRLAAADGAPERVNLLVGDAGAAPLELARRLAAHGLRVRLIAVDPVAELSRGRRRELEAVSVEVEFGRESTGIETSRSDAFVATDWRTAHVARPLGRFVYLIGDYEPLRHPAGTLAALAAGSYAFPHYALFSSEPLREYFRGRGLGVYADGAAAGDRASAVFEEAVTVEPPAAVQPARRLLLSGGELFELGVLGLSRALERGALAGWTLHGVATGRKGRLDLGGGDWMRLVDAAGDLREYDVGLAPLHGPRPGVVPIGMARAGMLAVTTTFESKGTEALAAISPNLVAAEPTVEGIADALVAAEARAGAAGARLRGSAVRWSTDWDASFHDALLDRLTEFLRAR